MLKNNGPSIDPWGTHKSSSDQLIYFIDFCSLPMVCKRAFYQTQWFISKSMCM